MSRSAKTKHVLDLVGSESVKKPVPSALREPSGMAAGHGSILQKPPSPRERAELDIEAIFRGNSPEAEPETNDASAKKGAVLNPPGAPEPPEEPEKPKAREGITVIVTELINQELKTVVERFNLTPSDSNLWELTRSAIETIRPEFSRNEKEYIEKCEKLRPRVIKEMTKAAIKVMAKEKKKNEEENNSRLK